MSIDDALLKVNEILPKLPPVVGQRVRLLVDVWDDGQDHHPPGYLAHKGEILIVRAFREGSELPVGVSHEQVTDNYFVVALNEIEQVSGEVSDSQSKAEGERVVFGNDVERALDADAESDTQGLPQTIVVHGRRYTGAYRKKIRGWPGKVHVLTCEQCTKKVAFADSTRQSIDEARTAGAVVRVMCDQCFETTGLASPEVVTDRQAEELETISKRIEKRHQN
jgi:hypothetical protein